MLLDHTLTTLPFWAKASGRLARTETQSSSLSMFLAWGCYSSSSDQDEGTESTVVVHSTSAIHILRPQARVYMHLWVRMGGWRAPIMYEWFSGPALWCQQSELLVGKEGLENQWELLIRYRGHPEPHPSVTQILVLGREWCGAAVLWKRWDHTSHTRRAWLHSPGTPQCDGPVTSVCGYSGILVSAEDPEVSSPLFNSIFSNRSITKESNRIRVCIFCLPEA